MQRTCENTDCKVRILGASVYRVQVRPVAGLDSVFIPGPSGLLHTQFLKYTLHPPQQQEQNAVLYADLERTHPSQVP